ncbi:MAG TPA: phosphatase PAP2-related protein [Pseudobdellovibrionaceae bacterium]|nr:phosphatase PAP2-related protein [Pseudobdellovibrionaceae bacterium]
MFLLVKAVLVVICVLLWWKSQGWIARKIGSNQGVIGDRVHEWTLSWHRYFLNHPRAVNGLLISSSLVIDVLGIFLIARTLFGESLRPLLGLVILFGLRQLNQLITTLPAPEKMIWRHPGVPSLFVTYGVSNDLFFSGHTALAVFAALELATLGAWWIPVAVAVILFEAGTMIVLRAHWTMDVFAGAVTALWVMAFTRTIAPAVDGGFERLMNVLFS